MRKTASLLVILIAVYLATGCGIQGQLNNLRNDENNDRRDIDDLGARISVLESEMAQTRIELQTLDSALTQEGSDLSGQIADVQASVTGLTSTQSTDETALQAAQAQIAGLQNSISTLQGQLNASNANASATTLLVNDLSESVSNLSSQLSVEYGQGVTAYNQIEAQLEAMSNSSSALTSQVTVLQGSLNAALVQLAKLKGHSTVVGIKDPCGKQSNQDEVFLRLKDGHYLASFSDSASGQNTRFSVLTQGSYTTTDNTRCAFDVDSNGKIVNEHNY